MDKPETTDPCMDTAVATGSNQTIKVTFKESDITVIWSDEYESLLDCAEEQGLTPDFSCRAGICSTCHCALIEGDVEYIDEPLTEPDEGYVLPCICYTQIRCCCRTVKTNAIILDMYSTIDTATLCKARSCVIKYAQTAV